MQLTLILASMQTGNHEYHYVCGLWNCKYLYCCSWQPAHLAHPAYYDALLGEAPLMAIQITHYQQCPGMLLSFPV